MDRLAAFTGRQVTPEVVEQKVALAQAYLASGLSDRTTDQLVAILRAMGALSRVDCS